MFMRIREECFPFIFYWMRSRKKEKMCKSDDILSAEECVNYRTLSERQLRCRIREEHQRALQMDERTVKFTLAFSIGFAVLGLGATFLIDSVQISEIKKTALMLVFSFGILYILIAGLTALGALRTFRRYGYGTEFLICLVKTPDRKTVLVDALARQECMNIVRHLRNEAAYQSLRNGLLLIIFGVVIAVIVEFHMLLLLLSNFI